ncbi:MAG: hypothetical protein AAGI25_03165 [Bacteroidota bacterium]
MPHIFSPLAGIGKEITPFYQNALMTLIQAQHPVYKTGRAGIMMLRGLSTVGLIRLHLINETMRFLIKKTFSVLSEIQRGFYIDADCRVFVHRGFTNSEGPTYEIDSAVCYWDRNLWRNALAGEDKLKKPDLLANFNEIYIGHTPTLNWGGV